MTVRIDKEGNITGLNRGEDFKVKPFAAVGTSTHVMDAWHRFITAVHPGAVSSSEDAGVWYVFGKDHEDHDVVIAYDWAQSMGGACRGIVVPSDRWVHTPTSRHLVRRFDDLDEAVRATSLQHTAISIEVDGWKGVCVYGDGSLELEVTEILELGGLQDLGGVSLPSYEPTFEDLGVEDPFSNKELFGKHPSGRTVWDVTVLEEGPAFWVTIYAYNGAERWHAVLQRIIPYNEFGPKSDR